MMKTRTHRIQSIRRRRKLATPLPEQAIHFIQSENFAAIAEYSAKLALLGNNLHISIIPVKGLLRLRMQKAISIPRLWFMPDEREQNLKTMGKPARGVAPPASNLMFERLFTNAIKFHRLKFFCK